MKPAIRSMLLVFCSSFALFAAAGVLVAGEPPSGASPGSVAPGGVPPPAPAPPVKAEPAPPQVPINLITNSDFETDADSDGVPDGWFHSEPQHWAGPVEGSDLWKSLCELWAKKGAVPPGVPFRPPDILEGGMYAWEASGYQGGHCISVDETADTKWGEWDTTVKDIKPNTDYVIAGWHRQSALPGRKADAPPWLKIAAFGRMIPVRGTIDRTGWVPFAVPVNSGEFRGACTIGFVIDQTPTKVWLDRVAMFEGTLRDLPRFRCGLNGARLEYPIHDGAFASPDIECPLFFDVTWSLHTPATDRHLSISIDLPEGLDLTAGDGGAGVALAEDKAQGITLEGRPYVRRTFEVLSAKQIDEYDSAGQRPVRLWLKAEPKLAQTTFEAFYHAHWKLGSQPSQPLTIQIIRFPRARYPKNLVVAIGGLSRELVNARAGKLARDLPVLGVNTLLTDTGLAPDAADSLDKAGVEPVVWFRPGGAIPQHALARDANNKIVPGVVCPTYRANDLTGTLFPGLADAVRSGSGELFTDLRASVHRTCFCPRCVEAFQDFLRHKSPELKYVPPAEVETEPEKRPELYAAWHQFRAAQMAEFYRTLRTELTTLRRQTTPARTAIVPLRLSALVPAPGRGDGKLRIPSLVAYAALAGVFNAEIVDNDIYRADDGDSPDWLGNEVSKLTAILPRGREAGAVITAGSFEDPAAPAPVFSHADVRDQVLEAVTAGAKTVILQPFSEADGMDLKQFSEAINLIAPFDRIVADGEPMDVLRAGEGAVNVRCIGREDQMLVLITDYSASPAATVKLSINFPERVQRVPMVLLDVETARVVARIPPDAWTLQVPLPHSRARLFYFGVSSKIPIDYTR